MRLWAEASCWLSASLGIAADGYDLGVCVGYHSMHGIGLRVCAMRK
jgi:hypothetical protein